MKTKKRAAHKGSGPAPVAAAAVETVRPWWHFFALGALVATVAVLWAYSPSMNGPFLFDDNFLPFAVSDISAQPLSAFLHGQRPLLMASYWLSARFSPIDTWWYHFLNVVIHGITTVLVFFIVRRLMEWAKVGESRRGLLAGLAAALFLLHPVQTEAVAYVAGRSEGLSVMLAFAAFAVFLYRPRPAAGWATAAAVFLLFGAALAAKESAIALLALLLLTDFWWNPGGHWEGIRRNWRIYAPMAVASLAGVAFFWNTITGATTAGFGLKDFTWYQYFFTQWRAIFVYLRLFLFPSNLTLDWDFPISHTVLEHGALVWLVALLALVAAAWHFRARFPLACYGFFAFLILLAPTSSILPIRDPVAERRLYFAMLGLLLIVADVLARIKVERKVLVWAGAAVVLLATVVTHARAEVWSDPLAMWEDTVQKSPGAWRPHFQLGFAYFSGQRCDQALGEFQKAAELRPKDPEILLDWGLAYDCLNQPEQALQKLEESAVLEPSAHVFSQIGMELGRLEKWPDALHALDAAEKMDPNYVDTYVYLGIVHTKTNQLGNAILDFQHALALDPSNTRARQYMKTVAAQVHASQGK